MMIKRWIKQKIILVLNPKEASHKWTRTTKLNTKWQAGLRDMHYYTCLVEFR